MNLTWLPAGLAVGAVLGVVTEQVLWVPLGVCLGLTMGVMAGLRGGEEE